MTAGPGSQIPSERLIVGDGLRAVAALSVLVYHTTQWIGDKRFGTLLAPAYGLTAAHIFKGLIYGLSIFFVLSGYLVFRGFARSIVLGLRRPSIRRYAAHRLLRIVPAFWVVLTLSFLVLGTRGASVDSVARMFGFAQIYDGSMAFVVMPQAWTLDVEMAFYLALPLLAWGAIVLTRRIPSAAWRATFLCVLIASGAIASSVRIIQIDPLPWEGQPFLYLIAFVPGMLAAVVEPLARDRVPIWLGRVLPPVLLLAALALLVKFTLTQPLATGWRTVLGALSAGAILWAALVRQWALGRGWRVLDNRPLRWLGERSYGVYLIHFLVLTQVWTLVDGIGSPWPVAIAFTLLTAAVTLPLAALSWRIIEVPAMRLRPRPRRLAVDLEPDSGTWRVEDAPA